MSNISKKIHSIDPVESEISPEKMRRPIEKISDPVPEFVTRPNAVFENDEPITTGRWVIWLGLVLNLLWIGGCLAYVYSRTGFSIASLNPMDLAGLVIVILFPALLVLFLCITGYKLSQVSANADRLANASDALLRADDVAAKQASFLAHSIRSEMNALEDDLSSMSDRLKSVQSETMDYVKNIEKNVAGFSNKTSSIGDNLVTQKETLDALEKSTHDRMQSLNSLIALRKGSLEKATENSVNSLNTAGLKFEQVTESFEAFTTNVENRINLVSETLSQGQKESTQTVLALGEHTEVLNERIAAMSAENKALKDIFDEQIALMEDFMSVNTNTQNAFKETLVHSRDAAKSLKDEARSGTDYLDKQRQEMDGVLSETKDSLSELRAQIEKLKRRADKIEGQQFSQADTVEMPLAVPQSDPGKPTAGRLRLRPLDQGNGEIAGGGNETSDRQNEAVRQILDDSEQLPLEPDLSIPSLRTESVQNEDLRAPKENTSQDDLIRPVNPSRSLFGRPKKAEKSGWKWRDMIGGFDSSDVEEESALDIVANPMTETEPSSTHQNFETWLETLDLNPDAIISDGTILDYASALIDAPENAQSQLDLRLKDISDYLISEAKTQPDIIRAAHDYQESFAPHINTQIMNKESVRSRLSLADGKAYILSKLV